MKTEADALMNDLRNCFRAIRANLVSIVLFGVLGFLIGSLLSIAPPQSVYQASSSISKTTVPSSSGASVAAYGDLLRTSRVLNQTMALMGGGVRSTSELSSMLSCSVNDSRNILFVYATHSEPDIAIKVVNAATEALAQQINEVFNYPGIVVLDKANHASLSSNWSKTKLLYRAGGAFALVAACCAYYVIRVLVSKRAMSIADCTLDGQLEIMGVIPIAPADQ